MVSKMKTLLKDTYPALLLVTSVAGWGWAARSAPDATQPGYAARLLEWNPREELATPAMENLACKDLTRAPAADRSWCETAGHAQRERAETNSNNDL